MEVLVYGTLKKGGRLHSIMSRSLYLGDARTTPDYHLISCGTFPAAIEGGEGSVHGELYQVTRRQLNLLDRVEGEGDLYHRKVVALEGSLYTPYMYVMSIHDPALDYYQSFHDSRLVSYTQNDIVQHYYIP